MYILGIHVGHNSTASLLKEGKVIGCISEERFTRNKNERGFPKYSVKWLFENFGITIRNIDLVCVVDDSLKSSKKKFSDKFLDDYLKKGFIKKIKSKLGYRFPRLFEFYDNNLKSSRKQKNNSEDLKNKVSMLLKIPLKKIITYI